MTEDFAVQDRHTACSHSTQLLADGYKNRGLFTANPEPVIEVEPLLHTRPMPGYKSGSSRSERPKSTQRNLSKQTPLGGAELYSKFAPPNS
jgi:hypothetical protein